MKTESELILYCFTLKPRSAFNTGQVPADGQFFLGYSVEGIDEQMHQKFGNLELDIMMHGSVKFQKILDMVDLPVPEPMVKTPEMNRIQFMNGLRLMADSYALPEDREALQEILQRIDLTKKQEERSLKQ